MIEQTASENPDLKQHINCIGRFENNNAAMFFIIEKSEETVTVNATWFSSIISIL